MQAADGQREKRDGKRARGKELRKGHMEARRGRTEEEAGHAASNETSGLRFQGSTHDRARQVEGTP